MEQALSRYQSLTAERTHFLDAARQCAAFTLPYLLTEDGLAKGERLPMPWQSVGAKGVSSLASKVMLQLFPVNTSFFKLSINDAELASVPDLTPEIRSEVDLSLSKMEKIIMQQIAETADRIQLHSAMKHLIVTGNVLLFAGKKSLKVYPLDRYVINRDGDGNPIEIITKESVHRTLLPEEFHTPALDGKNVNAVGEDGPKFGVAGVSDTESVDVYTCAKFNNGQWRWHQEADGRVIKGSQGSSPANITPWIPLRWNVVDGEPYGRSRVEEYLPDLKSLDGLMQALVEGSSAAAKVIFTVNPASPTKPQSIARAQNGAIISGRAEDVGVVNVGKTADFQTCMQMIQDLTTRLSDAFLILQPRKSERTTSTEIQMVAQELNEQLSGVLGNLTQELLQPYLNRKLHQLQRKKSVPTLPKGLVQPIVVAGLNGVGRGQDRQALMEFIQTVAQGMGPEALQTFIDPTEFLKRLAAASGIDTLNLIKSPETMAAEADQAKNDMMQASLINQAGQLAKTPMAEDFANDLKQNPETLQQVTGGQAGPPPSPNPEGGIQGQQPGSPFG